MLKFKINNQVLVVPQWLEDLNFGVLEPLRFVHQTTTVGLHLNHRSISKVPFSFSEESKISVATQQFGNLTPISLNHLYRRLNLRVP